MKLTAENLVKALTLASGYTPDDRGEVVVLARETQRALAATIYAAWKAEGDDLNPGLLYDLEAARTRTDYYRSIAAKLAQCAPGLIPIKGLEVADLYPDGFVRTMNDLDYVAGNQADIWVAAAALIEDGWDIHTATFSHFDGALQMMVSLRRPNDDQYQLPYGVEFATYYALGDLGGIAPIGKLPAVWRTPPIKNLLMLLHERFEQPYRARDLLDAALLLNEIRQEDLPTMHRAIAHFDLGGEYAELTRLVNESELGFLPAPPTPPTPYATRARRAARSVGFFRRPVVGAARHLQRRNVAGKTGPADHRLAEAIWPRMPVVDAIHAGLIAFGLPLDGPAPDVTAAVLSSRGKLAWVDTPIARFLLTIGDEVTESAVDELTLPSEAGTAAQADA